MDVAALDPNVEAPPMRVPRRPGADIVGHGRTLPMVGLRRNYLLDVVLPGGTERVYADNPADVLCELIDGYRELRTALAAAEELGDRDTVQAAYIAAFEAREDHAAHVRSTIQSRLNAEAQNDGRWKALDEEEQEQCVAAADPQQFPVGVLIDQPMEDPDGQPIVVERGVWETDAVKLVINRCDYGIFDPDGTPEPTCELTEEVDGDHIVFGGEEPPNMVVLDSTDDDEYFTSLEAAGYLDVTWYPPMVEDARYMDAVRAGRDIAETEGMDLTGWVGYDQSDSQ